MSFLNFVNKSLILIMIGDMNFKLWRKKKDTEQSNFFLQNIVYYNVHVFIKMQKFSNVRILIYMYI